MKTPSTSTSDKSADKSTAPDASQAPEVAVERDKRGRFLLGVGPPGPRPANPFSTPQAVAAKTRSGLRVVERDSAALFDLPPVAPIVAETEAAITADLGGETELSTIARIHVRTLSRLHWLQEFHAARLLDERGEVDPDRHGWLLQVVDRITRLGSVLGLQRRQKPAMTLERYLAEHYSTPVEAPAVDPQPEEGGDHVDESES